MNAEPTVQHLNCETEQMVAAATEACDATQEYARAANGNRGHVIPGATAYDLLGNTKALLWHLGEVIDYLPQGLQASLRDDRIRVYDRDPYTGADRDPATQVALATDHLRQLRQLVGEAAAVAEAAQTALNSQGWNATAALEDA